MLKFALRLAAKILSVALFIATCCAAYGGYVNPRLWATPSLLTLALPYLAMATFAASIGWALSRKILMTALGVATLVACAGPVFTAVPLGSEKTAQSGRTFTVMSFNIMHGIDYRNPGNKGHESIRYISAASPDIVCMQEASDFMAGLPKTVSDSLKAMYPYRIFDKNDLAVMSKHPIRHNASEGTISYTASAYSVEIYGRKVNILNVHLASYKLSDQEREVVSDIHSVRSAKSSIKEFKGSIMSKMKESFRQRADEAVELRAVIDRLHGPTVVCGDFNDVPASWAYREIKGTDLKDAFTETNFGHKSTYNAHRMPFHIDQIFYKGDLKALKVKREKEGSSDHYPILAEFEI